MAWVHKYDISLKNKAIWTVSGNISFLVSLYSINYSSCWDLLLRGITERAQLNTSVPNLLSQLFLVKLDFPSTIFIYLSKPSIIRFLCILQMFESTGWLLEEPDVSDDTKFDLISPTVVRPHKITTEGVCSFRFNISFIF